MRRSRLRIELLAILLALFAACPRPVRDRAALSVPSRQRDSLPGGYYAQPAGIADDYPEESTTEAKIRRDLDTARAAGVRWLRFGLGWDAVETAPGQYDFHLWDLLVQLAPRYGIALLPYVCYTPRWLSSAPEDFWRRPPADPGRFGRFMETAARRYAGRVPSWELWNEPDNEQYWLGTARQFADLVRAGAEGVRRGDPAARVVLGGMSKGRSPFLETLLREQRIGKVVDVVSLHGYLETWDARRAEDYPAFIGEVASLVGETAPRDDLWMAEFGYSDWRKPGGNPSEWSYAVHDYEHTAAFQGVALLRAHALALGTGVLSLTTWYRIDDLPASEGVIGDENNKHLGVLDARGRPKPAFAALRLWSSLFDAPVRAVAAQAGPAVVRVFEKPSGELIVLAWLPSARGPPGRSPDVRAETVRIVLPHPGAALEEFDPATALPARGSAALHGASIDQVVLRGDSIFVARVR
ncbi:MAG: GH39 family glycosyl hydrolase [Myxococcales bacterium]